MNKKTVLILGAKSDIGMAIAHQFAKYKYNIQLAAREISSLEYDKSDINIRYDVDVSLFEFDALKIKTHKEFISNLDYLPSIVISAIGLLGEQKINEHDTKLHSMILRTNFEGPASILGIFANSFEARGWGTIVGISSVAGERGRASNYIYGSSKAGLTTFLSGLRNRLSSKGVNVLTVIPGYVNTKMTKKLKLPKMLTVSPNFIANEIYKSVISKKNIIYTPKRWYIIIFIIKCLPEFLFKNIKL